MLSLARTKHVEAADTCATMDDSGHLASQRFVTPVAVFLSPSVGHRRLRTDVVP